MFVQAILRAAQIRADEPATICENRVRRWRESADRTARLAAALSALGARDGDRIAILGVNSDHYLEAMHDVHAVRSEEHTSELQSLMRISYAVFCLKKKTKISRNS